MDMSDFERLVTGLDGVKTRSRDGLLSFHYHSRLVARQLTEKQVVVRSSFDLRDLLLRQFPHTFSVPSRFAKHMMVVADLENGDLAAIEDAVVAAWRMQSGRT